MDDVNRRPAAGFDWRYARFEYAEASAAKIAAIEGHWENPPGEPTPLLLFGWPDMEQERTRYGLEIPALGSLILTHSPTNRSRH